MSETPGVPFWQDYWAVQTDPAHLLAELGFSIVFELLQIVLFVVVWHRCLKPHLVARMHRKFDKDHGLTHDRKEQQ